MKRLRGSLEFASLLAQGLLFRRSSDVARLKAVLSLFDEDKIVQNFSSMGQMFQTRHLANSGRISPLTPGADYHLSPEVREWITDRHVTGLVILKDGKLCHES